MLLTPRTVELLDTLIAELRETIIMEPRGERSRLCVTASPPESVLRWAVAAGRATRHGRGALQLAADEGVHLEPLGGTGGGVMAPCSRRPAGHME
jgi:hypothetical protein